MQFGILEILALILIGIAAIKIVLLFTNWPLWILWMKRIYARPQVVAVVALALAAALLYALVASGMSIVQILAVSLFVVLMLMAGIAPYASRLMAWVETRSIAQLLADAWLYTLAWVLLLAWGLWEIVTR
ncbi:MAG: hypothetical protein Q8K18_10380 [Burkholderiales bacterium]|nr:hypothetical protein [Burkholderiales bacterium]